MRRRPKQLAEAPALFRTGAGTPVVVDLSGERGTGDLAQAAGGQGVLTTKQTARHREVAELLEDRTPDPEVAALAQRIARRLAIRRRPRDPRAERGSGRLASVPYRYRSDDIDLDRTIEVLTERPVPEDTDIVVRERMRSRRDVVLIVDVSGSMRGEKVRMAAATVAALSADLVDDRLALVAFWSDAALLTPLEQYVPASRLLNQLLRIPARGLTNVHFALTVAHTELARSSARRRTAVLLTDAVHNAGPDPRLVARRFPELHVLLQTDGEHDAPLGADLARLGHGRFAPVAGHRDVAPALNRLLR
ncbi:VWA domain-containing protein [Pseudonocardia sp. KRD-169]|uniref:VWA domain-containing protein n=1 Tax=Pseudonocardia abyssalis TaxID=2792008 RepID=A0ABS6UZM1_9PSEU|nr:VWA domain-containing protein [Pseudonocardia abyssalis]MBW0137706.1 VWA domain-containing protein [Pseudonocardia abyssalis]